VRGGFQLDGGELPLAELLQALRDKKRFVQLDDERVLELGAALTKELAPLEALMRASEDKDGGLRASMFAAPLIAELESLGATVEGPPEWLLASKRLAEAATLEVEVPAGLVAELRPYQHDGLVWAARLAHWARGACLADEMGLGKTDPKAGPSSAKLDRLLELMTELRDEGRKVLVFSQFTELLALVRTSFDAAGLTYAYLDGSTPAERRIAEVDRFQGGTVDAFLLSLKAGGVGLNLTAASEVIHLDPWWNPAVEDQATGRAHRIGQDKAVTVYRLVAQGTIEEQILGLHGDKRAMVASLLEGTGSAMPVTVAELMALLSEEGLEAWWPATR